MKSTIARAYRRWHLVRLIAIALLTMMLSSCSTKASTPETTPESVRGAETQPVIDQVSANSSLYDTATLEAVSARYERTTNRILDEIIWPALLNDEKSQLGGRPSMRFPLWAEGAARSHPLAFYRPVDTNEIVFPLHSLKFLDDLCTAYAWLQRNGYGLETISEYTAILKYGDPPDGAFPPPLEALGIPEDALSDTEVDDLALAHFVTARMFIILHEMGHILHRHRANTFEESVQNEQEADQFAIKVTQRTPLPPLGIVLFFMVDAHWTGFPASERDTHPLSGQRVQALADAVDDPDIAQLLRELGAFIDDPDIRAGFVATGKAGNLSALKPRLPKELPQPSADAIPGECSTPFDGVFRGEIIQYPQPQPVAVEMHLTRQGDSVTGQYTSGLGIGAITGGVVDDQLYFDWEWAGNFGKGVFTPLDDDSFEGIWGYQFSASNAGAWSGQCIKASS